MTMNPSVSHNAVSRSHSIGASKYVIGALVIIIGLFAMFFSAAADIRAGGLCYSV